MTAPAPAKDLVVLVADKDMEQTVLGLLTRDPSLSMRPISRDVFVHPNRDGGCRTGAVAFLRPHITRYAHAIVLFDREGCGREPATREELEEELERDLAVNGWANRATVIVIDPELEAWVWSDSPEVERVLGWSDRDPPLRQWLIDRDRLDAGRTKPPRPKEAMRAALRAAGKPPSSALFAALARQVGLARCRDGAFLKLRRRLHQLFPR